MRNALYVTAVMLVAVLAYLAVAWVTSPDADVAERAAPPPPAVTSAPTPSPTVLPTWQDVQEVPSVSTKPESTTSETQEPTTAYKAEVGQSEPVQLYQPDTELNIRVLELPDESRDPMTPPTYMEAYWNPQPIKPLDPDLSYAPGSDTPDLSVIAAHTSFGSVDEGFNRFYDWREAQFMIELGDEVWVKTEASGDGWLVYKLVNQVFVPKGELADSSEVWGKAAKPNHLLLIGCRQIAPGEPSQDNFVLDFVFDRVDHL